MTILQFYELSVEKQEKLYSDYEGSKLDFEIWLSNVPTTDVAVCSTDTKLFNLDGSVNGYGLACGYVEVEKHDNQKKELYMDNNHYHVKHFVDGERVVWETFSDDELVEAYDFYNKIDIYKPLLREGDRVHVEIDVENETFILR
jgi:ABC-type ATPase with predicted acetyltransferase domain